MPVRTAHGRRIWVRRGRAERLVRWLATLAGALVLARAWAYLSERTIWEFVADAPAQAADLASRMIPPEGSYLAALWRPLWDTVNIATLGTLLAVAIAAPLAFLAARNTTPLSFLRLPALLAIVVSRSVNTLVWALLLVAVVGPGALAGVLAIGLRSIGFVGKLVYEAVEETDRAPVEAIAATGAGRAQVVAWGIAPQVLPAFAGASVFRWDVNIREATVLGLVGAGGIGLELDACVSSLQWSRASVILLAILALVLASEWLSARLRRGLS